MKREVELAKKLLESKGYKISKKMNEGPTYSGHDVSDDLQQYAVTVVIGGTDGDCENGMCEPDFYVDIVSAMDEDDARRQVERGLGPNDGITDVHLATDEEISEWESDAYDHMDEAYSDEEKEEIHSRWKERQSKKYPGKDIPMYSPKAYSDKTYDTWKSVMDKEVDESTKMKESDTIYITKPDDLVGHNPKFRVTYSSNPGETTTMTIEATDERSVESIIKSRCKRRGKNAKIISIEKISEASEEVLKPQCESSDLKYVCNTNGYSCYRKIENGKGVWFAKKQDDSDDKMFPISYDQARGYEDMPNPTEIEKLQKELGKMLLPQDEGLFKKKPKAGDQMRDLAKSAKSDVDDIKAQMEKFKNLNKKNESSEPPHTKSYNGYTIQSYDDFGATVYKNGQKVQEFENIEDAEEYIDGLSESKSLKDAVLRSIRNLHESRDYWVSYIGRTGEEYNQLVYGVDSEEEAIAQFKSKHPELKVIGAEEYEEYSPFKNGIYKVHGSKSIGREDVSDVQDVSTDSPEEAIESWFKIGKLNPTETAIMTQNKENAQKLIDWAFENIDKVEGFYKKYRCPYKLEFLINSINRKHENGISGFYSSEYGDQVEPFSFG